MTTADVAKKLNRPIADIDAWENGDDAPSYPQLEKLAYDLYKRPLAIFFLPTPPSETQVKTEFRSLPEYDLSTLERDTVLLIRKARAYQFALDELFSGRSPAEKPLWRTTKLSTSESVVAQAARVREELGVPLEEQSQWKDDDDALKQWRRVIEARGIFIFKNTFKQGEISGFCLKHAEFPLIMVNNSTTKTRQIFSLFHELVHLLFSRSGISTFDESRIEGLPPQDREVEQFCNEIAAEILVPLADFRVQATRWAIDPANAPEAWFANLAKRYHVSRAVVLRRFLAERLVSPEFYKQKTKSWDAQKSKGGSGGDYYANQKAYLSERFLREVVSRYSRRQLSRDEAADLIGIPPNNLSGLEDLVLRGAAA